MLWDGICLLLIALSCFGTYENSLFTGRTIAIFESRNPAFGGRGPGIHKYTRSPHSTWNFDSTRGFPGEGWVGWSTQFPLMKMTTWNCRSLTYERVQYCRSLGYDVLALTELWHNQKKFQSKNKSFIIAEPKIIKRANAKEKCASRKTGRLG